jgi:hypothetical protein
MPPPAGPKPFEGIPYVDAQAAVPTLITVPGLDSFSEDELKAAGDSLGRRHATVWNLAESGLSPEAISTSTGQPIGEIELILALRRRIQSATPAVSRDSRP